MHLLGPDEEPELIIADYVEAEDANLEEQGENSNQEVEKCKYAYKILRRYWLCFQTAHEELIPEIKETPPTAPDDAAKQGESKQRT